MNYPAIVQTHNRSTKSPGTQSDPSLRCFAPERAWPRGYLGRDDSSPIHSPVGLNHCMHSVVIRCMHTLDQASADEGKMLRLSVHQLQFHHKIALPHGE